MTVRKLIEAALPLEKINAESAREKSIRHGHPSTLHLWWARRPLAAARAVLWASLVDAPSSHPELFPTEEDQNRERQRLFKILEDLIVWENSDNPEVLERAKAEIVKSVGSEMPVFLDPFAGGGAIPLEAQRLGLEAHAHDLNPVAVMINKAMIEIPPRFAGRAPVSPEAKDMLNESWKGAAGLAEDVRCYGEWMKQEAFKRIGRLYPKVKLPESQGGGEATVIAWIWARTVRCPNPACGCEMPLASSFILSKKKGKEVWVKPIPEGKSVRFEVQNGICPKEYESFKQGKGALFKCPCCGEITSDKYVKDESRQKRLGSQLMAVVAEGSGGRLYVTPNEKHIKAVNVTAPEDYPSGPMPDNPRWFSPPAFGMTDYADIFTPRQLTALTTFSDLAAEAQAKAEQDALAAGWSDDKTPLCKGGSGALAYGQAIRVYLALAIDKIADYHSSVCSWHSSGEKIGHTFGRQAIPMVWDFAEGNPFCTSSGCFDNMLEWVAKSFKLFPASTAGEARQCNAQSDCGLRNIVVSTDPPYYDNIGYADLSDFFYVWLRRSLKGIYPDLFRTMLVPKAEELIATPYRHEGSKEKAKVFFEEGMAAACRQLCQYASEDIPVTIYYAYKQSEADKAAEGQASSGWETMLSAIIKAGFAITGTWPIRTEMSSRSTAMDTNALASSIVLVCRKRPQHAPSCSRRAFVAELKRELGTALRRLQSSNIAPVDLAQSAIGPGMGIYSKYAQVLEADGTPLDVRGALKIINKELDLYFNEQNSDLDSASRFCVDLYTQMAFNEMRFGDANTLATAKNITVANVAALGVISSQKGYVRLLERSELSASIKLQEECIWKLCQQLTYRFEKEGIEGCAKAIADMHGSNAERAKDLAYRLYTIAERKKWTQEAYAYNVMVISWQDIRNRAAALASSSEQATLEGF
ncbi:DUF1156 domain-containing protein [bacterium]|nr:DUF1156 domain-containing protein [bacterium]